MKIYRFEQVQAGEGWEPAAGMGSSRSPDAQNRMNPSLPRQINGLAISG